jgi:hypothetical protein
MFVLQSRTISCSPFDLLGGESRTRRKSLRRLIPKIILLCGESTTVRGSGSIEKIFPTPLMELSQA